MAENLKYTGNPLGLTTGNGKLSTDVKEAGLMSSEIMVFEQWLKGHLSTLYQDVLGEPLPKELNEIVERFEAGGRRPSDDCRPTMIASVSMTQLP